MIRALIVDDEPLARRRVRALCAIEPDVAVVGECADGESAIAAIARLAPDLVFLDVQMPERDGFEVLERLAPPLPQVVFVTAYDEHALRAFEVRALDYLLKPFRRERFAEALRRVRGRLPPPERLAVRDGGRIVIVPLDDLDWLEADGNYVKLHARETVHLVRETLVHLEERLDARRFLRTHRSVIINVERLAEIVPSGKNDAVVVLRDGTRLPLSRTYRARLEGVL